MKTKFPEPESSEYAEEGTAFHAAVEAAFNDYLFNGFSLEEALKIHGDKCTDQDMREHVEKACREMKAQLEAVGAEKIKRIALEEKFMLSNHPGIGGTADFIYLVQVPDGIALVIWDWKYGAGVGVETKENLQLIGYACAANATKGWGPVSKAVVFIYQPRFEHPEGPLRRLKLTAEEIKSWTEKILEMGKKVKRELDNEAPTFNPGEHCQWCVADGKCAAQLKGIEKAAEIDFLPAKPEVKPKLPSIGMLTPQQKEALIIHRKTFEKFLETVSVQVLKEVTEYGAEYLNLKLVRSKTRRAWKGETSQIIEALKAAGMERPSDVSPRALGAVTKELGTKKAEEIFAEYTIKPEGALQVVSVTDKRRAVVLGEDALEDFSEEGEE
jgi:hypothetical protein